MVCCGVAQAAGLVEGRVGDEAAVGLLDNGVLALEVGAAVGGVFKGSGEGGHEGGAGRKNDVAGGVEDMGDGRI